MYTAYIKHKRSSGGALEIKDNELSRLMWSIGDRYHDWWPTNRGVIENYKKCGDWKFIPSLIHYGIICDSIIAFKKKYDRIVQPTQPPVPAAALAATPILDDFYSKVPQDKIQNFFPLSDSSVHESTINYDQTMVNTDSEEKEEDHMWLEGNLAQAAAVTLGYLGGVSSIEDNILERFTEGMPIISTNVRTSSATLLEKIKNYREICEQLFGDLTNIKWFAVMCDADIGSFCKLFINILETAQKSALGTIKTYCLAQRIPVMYMIKTPQTITDSSNNQSFIPCLTLYRFPITHIRAGSEQNFSPKGPEAAPAQNMPHPVRVQPNITANPDNYAFTSKLDSLAEGYNISYHPGIPAANGVHPEMPYTFDEDTGGSSFIYRIDRPPSAPVANAAAAVAPVPVAGLRFDIQYGNVSVQYRNNGPSLSDLMLHYIHKNLKDFNNEAYPEKGFPPNSSSIFSKDIHYMNQPFSVFKRGFFNVPEYIMSDEANVEVEKTIKPVRIYNKLNNIRKIVDSSLGILPPDGAGSIDEPSYTMMPANSLCHIQTYNQVPAVIMTVIKILGDYDQAVAARVLNTTTEFYGRIVLCSIDRSCVAHSANNGVRTIRNNRKTIEPIIMYNCTPAGAAVQPSPPAVQPSKKRKQNPSKQNGGFNDMLDDCDNQCLDIKQTMLTAGMNASRYLGLYKKYIKPVKINDQRHSDVLLDIYNDICDKYNMYNRDLENDITDFNVKYKNNMKVFMSILNDLYYNSINKNKSLKMLIALCNIHNRNYMLPEIDYTQYIKQSNSLSHQSRKKSASYKKSASHKKSAQSHKKSSSHLREKILYQLRKKSSQSRKKSSQSRKKSSQSRKKSSQSRKKSSQSRKKSAQSHEKILYQPRKKSSLHKIMAPVAGGF